MKSFGFGLDLLWILLPVKDRAPFGVGPCFHLSAIPQFRITDRTTMRILSIHGKHVNILTIYFTVIHNYG